MSKDCKLAKSQVSSAVKALFAYRKREQERSGSSKMLDLEAEPFTVQIGLKEAPKDPSPKPHLVKLPHALRDVEALSCCLIVKDADKPWLKALTVEGDAPGAKVTMTKLDGTRAANRARRAEPQFAMGDGDGENLGKMVDKVLSFSKLRTSYKQFKDKRELRDRFDVFLADERIVPMLGKLLGKTFFDRKKQPVAVKVTKPGKLASQIKEATSSARFVLKAGTCVALNLAHTDLSEKACVENVLAGVDAVVDLVPKKWSNVLQVSLKLPESAALPLFNASPNRLATTAPDAAEASEQAETADGDAPPAKAAKPVKRKTPAAKDADDASPVKKTKRSDKPADDPAEANPAAPQPKKRKARAPQPVAEKPARTPSLKDKLKAKKAKA